MLLERLTSSVNSGNLFVQRRLTISDMKNYAERTYHGLHADESITTASLDAAVSPVISQPEGRDVEQGQ